jgi:hypothetical protein
LEVPVEQLPVNLGRGREAWPVFTQMELGPAEGAAAGRFTLVKHRSDLDKLIREDLAQQEDGSLERLELLKQGQERQRDGFLQIDALFRLARFGFLCCEDRLQ